MNADHRILASYGYLAALVLVGAATATLGFHALGRGVGDRLASTVAEVEAARTPGGAPLDPEALVASLRETEREARAKARRSATFHGLLATLALVSLAYLSRELRVRLLDRLDAVESVARAVAEGDRKRRVPAGPADELGVIARELNAALDAQLAAEAALQGQLRQDRQLVLGLLAALPEPAVVLALDGRVIASAVDPESTEAVRVAVAAVGPLPAEPGEERTLSARDGSVRLRTLATADGRVVGALAVPLPRVGHRAHRRRAPQPAGS